MEPSSEQMDFPGASWGVECWNHFVTSLGSGAFSSVKLSVETVARVGANKAEFFWWSPVAGVRHFLPSSVHFGMSGFPCLQPSDQDLSAVWLASWVRLVCGVEEVVVFTCGDWLNMIALHWVFSLYRDKQGSLWGWRMINWEADVQ